MVFLQVRLVEAEELGFDGMLAISVIYYQLLGFQSPRLLDLSAICIVTSWCSKRRSVFAGYFGVGGRFPVCDSLSSDLLLSQIL